MAVLIAAPLVLPEFWRRFLTEVLIWGLLAMSSDLLIGYTGMISFGHSAFFGLGMYGAAGALIAFSPNLWLAILFGLTGAAGAALFVAYFSTRLRDIYFAITTLIFSQIFYVIIFTWTRGHRRRERFDLHPAASLRSHSSTMRASHRRPCTGSCWWWSPAPI
jgi:branched-chain amino acid transport system permease protein